MLDSFIKVCYVFYVQVNWKKPIETPWLHSGDLHLTN